MNSDLKYKLYNCLMVIGHYGIYVFFIFVTFLLLGCSSIQKTAYAIQHKDDPIVDPKNLSGILIVSKDKSVYIRNVIDVTYNNYTKNIEYTQNVNNVFVSGKIKYSDVDIFANKGRLVYDLKNLEWTYVENDKVFSIYQDEYLPIDIE